jgi:hypothetical protein
MPIISYFIITISSSQLTAYIMPDLFITARCAGTRSHASAGHHWFHSSNPALHGPGLLTSNSKRVLYFYGSPNSFTSLTIFLCITLPYTYIQGKSVHLVFHSHLLNTTGPCNQLPLWLSPSHTSYSWGFSQRPLLASLSGKKTLSWQYLWNLSQREQTD